MTFLQDDLIARPPPAGSVLHLRLLATSDLHANLLPFDYFTDRRAAQVGLARLAGMIARARAEVPNLLLLDNGDTLQGTPLADAAASEILPAGHLHPMIAAMNALGYDAATIGNHDFDYGLDHLMEALAGAAFPVVSANCDRADGRALLPRSRLLLRRLRDATGQAHDLRIGVTGCLPPQTRIWNRPGLEGRVAFADMVERVATKVAILRAGGADLVVVLAHCGLGTELAPDGAENAALRIAGLPGVDAVVAGHTHAVHPDAAPAPAGGTPVVQPGAFGSHLGQIDLTLVPFEDGWRVARATSGTLPARLPAPESRRQLRTLMRAFPGLHRDLASDHRTTRGFVARPLGSSRVRLETYFSALAPCAATQLVADAQLAAARPLVADDPGLRALPLLSAVAPFKAGGRAGPTSYTDIPAGVLKLRHAADLYLYPNMLSVLRVSGQGIRDWLERAASLFNRIDPRATAPQTLIDHDFAPYNFDRIVGLRYRIDVSRPARTNADGDRLNDTEGRIGALRLEDGRPLDPGDEVLVVTNSYRAAGGGHMQAAGAAEIVRETEMPVREAVARHISAAGGAIAPEVAPTWSLEPLGGVLAIFDTGPGALACKARWSALGLTPMPATPDPRDPDGARWQPFHLRL